MVDSEQSLRNLLWVVILNTIVTFEGIFKTVKVSKDRIGSI